MKKTISAVLIAVFLITICGCNQQPQAEGKPSQTAPSISEATNKAEQRPLLAVVLPPVTEESTAQDGTVILKSVYQNMELTLPDPEIADAVIVDYLNRLDIISASTADILKAAEQAYTPNSDYTPYLSQITFSPKRIDHGVLSLFGSYVVYQGSAHPEVMPQSITYDLITGKALKLSDIISNDEELLQTMLATLDETKDTLYENYENTVKEHFIDSENWYLSDRGFVFYFAPYEIAPYSAGIVTAEIPYEKLSGILKDHFFPAERDAFWGELMALPFNQSNMEKFTQTAEVVCGSTPTILYTDGILENVSISLVDAQNTQTVLCAYTLSPGDALVIHGEAEQQYQVRYNANGDIVSKALTFTKDGTPHLS